MQTAPTPTVSVITPTHNRSASLRRTLDALAAQTFPLEQLEVVVVADGCTDDTAALLRAYPAPFALSVVEQAASGAAGARNAGARIARAPLLVFIDDDIAPAPGCVAAHVRAHEEAQGGVVMGPYPPLPLPTRSIFRQHMRNWWLLKFASMAEAGHRFTYQDLLTGNLSLSAELWARIGGLDESFREAGGEDYELGVRLIAAGVPFVYVPEAAADHYEHETMSVVRAFRRAYNEGCGDVLMSRKHSQLAPGLDFVRWRKATNRRQRAFVRAIYLFGSRGDGVARAVQRLLPWLDRTGLRKHWVAVYYRLRLYWYIRGVTAQIPSGHAWAQYAWREGTRPAPAPALIIDLRDGLEAAEARLDAERPASVALRYGAHVVSLMPAAPAAEPWRGVHLRPFLLREASAPLLSAMALEGAIADLPPAERGRVARAIEEAARFFGPEAESGMWVEQYRQWDQLDRQLARFEQGPEAGEAPPVPIAEVAELSQVQPR